MYANTCLLDLTPNRVLVHVEASLNEGALTLVNAGQPCLRIIFDLKAELQKKRADWTPVKKAQPLATIGEMVEAKKNENEEIVTA